MGVKGSKQNHRRKSLKNLCSPPKPQCTSTPKERSKQSTCTIADSSSEFVQWLKKKILYVLRFGLKSHFEFRKHLSIFQQTNKNIFCPNPLISAYSDMTFISLVSIYCLSLKDLVLAQCGKFGSDYKSRGVIIIRMKHK